MPVTSSRRWGGFAECVALVAGAAVIASAQGASTLLERASAAAVRAGEAWRGVVAREDYVQTMRAWPGVPPRAPARGAAIATRRLVADLLLVYDASGPWELHRDVLEVNGRAVTDRAERLQALFLRPELDARQRLRDVTRESARFNLGDITRTFNVPTFPLVVVHPLLRDRFRLDVSARPSADGLQEVAFTEMRRPTLVRSTLGHDVPLQGRLTLDVATGEIVRVALRPEATGVQAHIEIDYGPAAGMDVRVPVRMWEWYRIAGPLTDPAVNGGRGIHNAYVDALATYSQFRRYAVTADATVAVP